MNGPPSWNDAIGKRVKLPGHFADPVTIERVDDYGDVLSVAVRTGRGEPKDATVEPDELRAALAAVASSTTEGFVDSERQFLLVESSRIRLAYAWDPCFAVSLSGIEPLPHQLEAVYQRMLPQARLRFLLADDPGAGKTIMAGLLLKELKLRGAVERVLILSPAPLTLQWQDELKTKFDEVFEPIDSHMVRDQLGGSPWGRFPQCVASLDFAKQEHIAADLLRQRWDLVIIDEAHKCTMPNIEKPTNRYKLVRQLVDRAERLLLLTATPHQGNRAQFRNLLGLLDEQVFRNDEVVDDLLREPESPWIIRRMKENLRDFAGHKLFVDRYAYTEEFTLNEAEWTLYQEVSEYINTYLPKQMGRKKQSAALARTVLQRRVASSLRAIRISVENRQRRIKGIVEELETLPDKERLRRLQQLANLPVDEESEYDDETEEALDKAAQSAVAVERFDQLVDEVKKLEQLVALAVQTEQRGDESKLNALFDCLERAELKEFREQAAKLLVFTEHRATLDYLRENFERRGYTCCVIHGGMPAVARKDAQTEFLQTKQVCIATDAAGEGINLQFCHLMINYDLPWNPTRLEQRMGRIHRFGQEREVHVFNFVAKCGPEGEETQPVIEGRIMQRLLKKLDDIRDAIGDRVFDVIGLLLRTNELNLEEVLREATYNPGLLKNYTDRIEKLSAEKLHQFEESTGVALARHTVDLNRIQGIDFESEERRLMPEYVEDYFLQAAQRTGLRVERRANPNMLRIETVTKKFLARNLVSVRRVGEADKSYPKATFRKDELKKQENLDGVLLSPGHPVYAAVDEVLLLDLKDMVAGTARYLDGCADAPYRVHFFEIELEGESLGDPGQPPRTMPVFAKLVAVQESEEGALEEIAPDLLHDLKPVAADKAFPAVAWKSGPDAQERQKIEGWLRAKVQHPLVREHRERRAREVDIRRNYLSRSFEASISAAQRKQFSLHARVLGGEKDAEFARDMARSNVEHLEGERDHRIKSLDHMEIVRTGRVAYLGSALVAPAPSTAGTAMRRDVEVELFAYDFVTQHETGRGWEVDEVWKRNDGSGFDLRSVSQPDEHGIRQVRRIEVKGRAEDRGEVHLSPNEWRKAERLGDTYWLYVVWGCKTAAPRLKMIQNPWKRLHAAADEVTEVKGYRVPFDALAGAEGEEWKP